MAFTAVAGAAVAVGGYFANKSAHAQKDAINDAKAAQAKNELAADQALNRANPKKPNTSALLSSIEQSAKGGPSGTMLTGPTGIDPSQLTLGRSTLLGGG